LPALPTDTPLSQSWYSTTVPNQIASWSYDKNGNLLQEGSVARSFAYDGDNNQVTATIGSGTSTYVYDGLGQRVSKTVNGQITTYVYDAFGNLAAEYGGDSSGCGTCYVTTDHLGTTRLLTNSAGNVFARYDYEPFGTEIGANYDGRTTAMGFTAMLDDTNPKFTGQMRDQETTLDFFSVRYMSGAQGRFQSPDPGNAGADPSNPQSWNGYAYVANNPLSYTDPSGMFVEATAGGCALGGPIGCAIGAAIDIGAILAGIFGSGGPPPSIPPSLATPSSPILQPSPDFDSQGWNEQIPGSGSGSIDSGTLFGSGNTDPFVFSFGDGTTATGQWVTDYKGDLVWVAGLPSRTAKLSFKGATLKAGPARGKLNVAGGCVVDAFKDNILGIGLATAAGPLPKVLTGSREIGSTNTTLLSKLGSYFNIRMTSPVFGPGARSTTNLLRGAGRVLGPAAMVINGAELLKTAQDAGACYSRSY
jgi:RHS repeat-associated protein